MKSEPVGGGAERETKMSDPNCLNCGHPFSQHAKLTRDGSKRGACTFCGECDKFKKSEAVASLSPTPPDGGSPKENECIRFIRQCVAGRCDRLDLEVIRGEIDGVLEADGNVESLRRALKSLYNEVHGALGIAELEIRAAIGNTNLACIERRLSEAKSVLSGAAQEEAPRPSLSKPDECQWCHASPCTCPHGWPEAQSAQLNISEADLRGVFGHKCDQANCPVCHPDMTLTEMAELYERAATPHDAPKVEEEAPREEWRAGMKEAAQIADHFANDELSVVEWPEYGLMARDRRCDSGMTGVMGERIAAAIRAKLTPGAVAEEEAPTERESGNFPAQTDREKQLECIRADWSHRIVDFEHNCVTLNFLAAQSLDKLLGISDGVGAEEEAGSPTEPRCPSCKSPAPAAKYCLINHKHGFDAIPSCKWCDDPFHSVGAPEPQEPKP